MERIPLKYALVGWCETDAGNISRVRVLDQRKMLAGDEPDAGEWRACTHTAGACVAGWNPVNCAKLIHELLPLTADQDGALHQFDKISWGNTEL